MNHIFILGGSKLQLDLIYEAKKMYFHIHLFDANENCIGKKYADTFYHIDIKDKESILAKAKCINPVAVLTIATEVGNTTSCYVSEKLGLNSNSYNVALNTTNKEFMKNICLSNNITTAKYQIIQDSQSLNNWSYFPAIIKPLDSSAGRGVSFIESQRQLEQAVDIAHSFSNNDKVIVEQYIKGKQYSIETISSNNKHRVVTITEEFITPLPKIIETKHLIPARISDTKKDKINEFALSILNAFDIKYGASHIEVREDKDGKLYFIELASRMGGWRSELINFALGINYCQLLLFSILNKSIEFVNTKNDIAVVKMILSKKDFQEYKNLKEKYNEYLIDDLDINDIKTSKHLADSNGYYFIHIENAEDVSKFIEEHQ